MLAHLPLGHPKFGKKLTKHAFIYIALLLLCPFLVYVISSCLRLQLVDALEVCDSDILPHTSESRKLLK